MPFPSPLSAPQQTAIRAGSFNSSAYILANPVQIVFSAQVNQASFDAAFASIDFDNIVTGAITDVLDGFTVYISDTSEDVLTPTFELRARGDGSAGTTINVNENSFDVQDDQYITVVKAVVGREKLGNYVNKVMKVDWNISFRQLLPLITNLQSAYGKKLVANSAIFSFPAVGFATTKSASISSWLWDADGGSFVNGTVATDAQPDIEYTVAGVYWPRVAVVDSGGRTNWFTMPVFVMSPDMSDSFIITGVENLSITSRIGVGDELNFAAFSEEFIALPARSTIVVWEEPSYAGDTTPIVDSILFVGRLRKETPRSQIQGADGPTPDTNFTCEGFLAQMNRIRSPQLALSFSSSPTTFGKINGMTQWRIVVFILSEFSTFLNLCSLRFDDETEDYLNAEDNTEDKALLASVNGLLSARKSALNIARQGELYGAQSAVFLPSADRNALDTIHKFTTADIFRYSTTNDKVPTVGSVDVFGGGYTTSDGSLRIIRAVAPAVASLEAQGGTKPVDGILLETDSTAQRQQVELEQLTGNELADANPKDQPNMDILDGFYFISPTNFQWWGLILATTDNNRGIEYKTTDRFLLESVTITYNNQLNTWNVTAVQRAETEGVGAKTLSQVQPGVVDPKLPGLPTIPVYPKFPADDDIFLPDGWDDLDLPAIGQNDGIIVILPLPPSALIEAQTDKGAVVAHWDLTTNQLYLTTEFTETDSPIWNPVFTATLPLTIKDFKFDPHSQGAYLLLNDDAGDTEFYRTEDIFVQIPVWTMQSTTLDDIDYTTIRTTATPGEVYIFGVDDRTPPATISLLAGGAGGKGDLIGSSLSAPHSSSSNAAGTYNEANDWFEGSLGNGSDGGTVCNVELALPARALIQTVVYTAAGKRDTDAGGERVCQVSLDGVSIGGTNSFAVGSASQTLNITKNPGGIAGSTILFHVSIDRETGTTWARLTKVILTLTDSGQDMAAFRRSDTSGGIFYGLKTSGVEIVADPHAGFDTGAIDTSAFLPADDVLRGTDDYGVSFGSKSGSDTVGTYAKAVWSYGDTATADTILATDALFDTTKTMINIINGAQNDITPDDGVDEGIVVGRDAIAMSRVSEDDMWGIFDFGGTPKLAYSDDAGVSWTISGESLTPAATYLRVKDSNVNQVYIINSTVVLYSSSGGTSFRDKTTPSLNIKGVEVR